MLMVSMAMGDGRASSLFQRVDIHQYNTHIEGTSLLAMRWRGGLRCRSTSGARRTHTAQHGMCHGNSQELLLA